MMISFNNLAVVQYHNFICWLNAWGVWSFPSLCRGKQPYLKHLYDYLFQKLQEFGILLYLEPNPNHLNMKKLFILPLVSGILLMSCGGSHSGEIPFKPVANDTAGKMILKYLKPEPGADTNFREVPKVLSLDAKTLETFTAKNKEGDVLETRFILAAYLDSNRISGLKNTILLRVKRSNDKYYYYDLRIQWDPKSHKAVPDVDKGNGVCPPPIDCIPPGVGDLKE